AFGKEAIGRQALRAGQKRTRTKRVAGRRAQLTGRQAFGKEALGRQALRAGQRSRSNPLYLVLT
ncbi:MAG TPA: hypothetical protein VFS47_12705, partial [Steroidobacteraceae bacterium]|nr:hypothetical protein [Steroidobacteraceae bacterium]